VTPGLAAQIAALPPAPDAGVWQRHVSARYAAVALDGYTSNGRWGTADGFPVLYLGRPTESVLIEAYRHLVDPVIFDTEEDRVAFVASIGPRVVVTCKVDVTHLLDLRTASARAATGLTLDDLRSAPNHVDAYARCRTVSQVAHQLGWHGILAPAATNVGETLVLFTDQLPEAERPIRSRDDLTWTRLPADPREAPPRMLHAVRNDD
jgi:RES domain-containing protein